VLKVGGGWHGAQPYALKGISVYKEGLVSMESAGLPPYLDPSILITEFNNTQDLKDIFEALGDKISCFIMEPFIGAGGFIFGSKEYIRMARELTRKKGALLIMDEVISGFRFHPGPLQTMYGIEADLSVFGKAIGGGMPVSAVAGKEDVLRLCSPDAPSESRVKFEGGTFSAHPASMLAGIVFLEHLCQHADEIYPRIGRLGRLVRGEIESIFRSQGFNVTCTGGSNDLDIESSVIGVHFLKQGTGRITSPNQVWNAAACDFEMREKIFKLAMLNRGFHIFHGFGTISSAHSDRHIKASLNAVEQIAKKWKDKGLVL
jgi:glutamate-1-semialdehyde 2,1-aminomutase